MHVESKQVLYSRCLFSVNSRGGKGDECNIYIIVGDFFFSSLLHVF